MRKLAALFLVLAVLIVAAPALAADTLLVTRVIVVEDGKDVEAAVREGVVGLEEEVMSHACYKKATSEGRELKINSKVSLIFGETNLRVEVKVFSDMCGE